MSSPTNKISGFTIARNVVELGYPIRQCVEALANVTDEVILCYDPTIDDGTFEVCQKLREDFDVKLVVSAWNMENRNAGTEIGRQTDIAMSECYFDWQLHCQLDEAFHEQDRNNLHLLIDRATPDITGFEFQRVCFYGDMSRIRRDWTIKAVRLTRKRTHTYATLDGHNCVPTTPGYRPLIPEIWIYHYQRFGNPLTISKRIQVLDSLFHPADKIPKDHELKPYDFKPKNIDTTVDNPEVREIEPEFLDYTGTHPRAFLDWRNQCIK
jgi:hypothetical protein